MEMKWKKFHLKQHVGVEHSSGRGGSEVQNAFYIVMFIKFLKIDKNEG